ncbi:MAG: hypothetical protein IKU76_04690 [Bacteroidaceae bacterium]|nr:hypothetical protein [Bacteroidaceae bacterium]
MCDRAEVAFDNSLSLAITYGTNPGGLVLPPPLSPKPGGRMPPGRPNDGGPAGLPNPGGRIPPAGGHVIGGLGGLGGRGGNGGIGLCIGGGASQYHNALLLPVSQ